ncbi:MAG: GNAT family N-acetyltransferase [Paludibacteraceae bacterium]|nr:GNAT family N-acetyltransferase [Paludibacteraceae bacterium]
MNVRIINNITNEIYEEASKFKNFSIYHTKNWANVLKKSFGWNISAVVADDADRLVYFLPFISKFRMNFKKYNISLPLSHLVRPLYKDGYADKLVPVYSNLSETGSFELHAKITTDKLISTSDSSIITTNLREFSDCTELYQALGKDSIQRKIKKAEKSGVIVKEESSLKKFIEFADMQVITRKKQGSPAYPQNFFKNIYTEFNDTDMIKLYISYYDTHPVAGVMFLNYGGYAIYGYGASLDDRDMYKLGVNQIAMWTAIKRAYENGFHTVDFGKTPHVLEDLRQYKLKWASKEKPLYYTYTKDCVKKQIDRGSSSFNLVSNVLKKTPTVIYKKISPMLLKVAL